ncbi:MAG: DUF1592 domain-containing protein [Nannocystales bacterium]
MREPETPCCRALIWAFLLTAPGCYAGLELDVDPYPDASGGEDGEDGEDGTSGESGGETGGISDDADSACGPAGTNVIATAPMRRLTRHEYNNTVRDVLDDHTQPADALGVDIKTTGRGFDANRLNDLTTDGVEDLLGTAEAVAARAVVEHDLPTWLGCDPDVKICVESFVAEKGRLLYRRPLTDEERTAVMSVYGDAAEEGGPQEGMEAALTAMLASPHFTYLVELGEPVEPGSLVLRLSSYEVAARLSYFLWSSGPDSTLLDRAEAGALDDPAAIEAEARRMLADDRARDTIGTFTNQWLRIDTHLAEVDDAGRDAALYPMWSETLRDSMLEELTLFVDDIVRIRGLGVDELLTASYGFVDADLAEVYGVEAPALPMMRVELDPQTRSGLLTRAAVMASSASSPNEPNLIYRGLLVRNELMCGNLELPEMDVDQQLSSAERVADPYCGTCHSLVDPLGQTFDAYDSIGALRTMDNEGNPIDATGVLFPPETLAGPGALIDELIDSETVDDCLLERWTEFGLRTEGGIENEECTLEVVREAYESSGHDLREAIVALTTTDAFRFRRLAEED